MMNPDRCCRPPFGLRRAVLLVVATVALAGVPAVAFAATPSTAPRGADSDTTKGTELVERFFDLLRDGNVAGLEKFLSPAFQIQRAEGPFLDKEEYLANPATVESYELSEVRATRTGKVIVVRYDVEAEVLIDGVLQSRDPAPRLSVFTKGKKGWRIVAHANFNVPAEAPQQ
jgi:hypothetical protein